MSEAGDHRVSGVQRKQPSDQVKFCSMAITHSMFYLYTS